MQYYRGTALAWSADARVRVRVCVCVHASVRVLDSDAAPNYKHVFGSTCPQSNQ